MAEGRWETRAVAVPLKSSPSLLYNNLSSNGLFFAFAHKDDVHLLNGSSISGTTTLPATKVPNKDSFRITQAKWLRTSEGIVLVVCSTGGVKFYDNTGNHLLFTHAMDMSRLRGGGSPTVTPHTRGVTAITGTGGAMICVGTSDGGILFFDMRDTSITFRNVVANGTAAITELSSESDSGSPSSRFVAVDSDGGVVLWEGMEKKATVEGDYRGDPCTSVRTKEGNVYVGYGSGHVRVFDTNAQIKYDIAAHSRFITAMEVHRTENTLVTVGLDAVVNVWRFAGEDKVDNIASNSIFNANLCGVQFLPTGAIVCAVYDERKLHVFNPL